VRDARLHFNAARPPAAIGIEEGDDLVAGIE
jgi:hypothetical protein